MFLSIAIRPYTVYMHGPGFFYIYIFPVVLYLHNEDMKFLMEIIDGLNNCFWTDHPGQNLTLICPRNKNKVGMAIQLQPK